MILKTYIIFALIVLIITRFRKVTTASQAYSKAQTWDTVFRKDKALASMIKSIDLMKDDKEKSILFKMIGMRYCKMKEYYVAVNYFEQSFEIALPLKFFYSPGLSEVIQAYLNANQPDRAKELYDNFLARSSYDRKFNKLKKLEGYFTTEEHKQHAKTAAD
ncbi:hypothetical protein [Paenibacillus glycanilyticus]|uniref:Tetratricopeptide repeat protein n=1 Tax=Paenibacillus glycanilyticus TaxID=126569 RepID=A0ABQ6G4C7_9BACL|nr:hypothetical protein [Paenibacillus glycanilyticus]GLX65799.1 hypothetical protein MU1_01430 [Paenibacillus glycanilyticus]